MSRNVQHIAQGEYAVGGDPEEIITTLLGSCVAVCLHDPVAQVGGMNHILLPEETGQAANGASFGVNAMELLINSLIKYGGNRNRFVSKVFGGAQMVKGLSTIGRRNCEFVESFLRDEGIQNIGGSTGGDAGRRVQFWPHSGKVRQKFITDHVVERPTPKPKLSDVELF
ncbi:MAG: chemotaxis protein CheD [Mangrovicoccus sp.]